MSKITKTELSQSEIKALVKAFQGYKKAETAFREVRDELTKGLKEGKYVSKYGVVNKTSHIRNYIDWNALLEDNPKINKMKYTDEKKIELITITPNI